MTTKSKTSKNIHLTRANELNRQAARANDRGAKGAKGAQLLTQTNNERLKAGLIRGGKLMKR